MGKLSAGEWRYYLCSAGVEQRSRHSEWHCGLGHSSQSPRWIGKAREHWGSDAIPRSMWLRRKVKTMEKLWAALFIFHSRLDLKKCCWLGNVAMVTEDQKNTFNSLNRGLDQSFCSFHQILFCFGDTQLFWAINYRYVWHQVWRPSASPGNIGARSVWLHFESAEERQKCPPALRELCEGLLGALGILGGPLQQHWFSYGPRQLVGGKLGS